MLKRVVLALALLARATQAEFAYDDEHPDAAHYTVLDDDGEPLPPPDALIESAIECAGDEPLHRVCALRNVCFDARVPRVAAAATHAEPYDAARDFWLLAPHNATRDGEQTLRVALLQHRGSAHVFGATWSSEAVRHGAVQWVPRALVGFRQYLANYYHVLMDDAVALWWLARRAVGASRDVPLLLLDAHDAGRLDIGGMLRTVSRAAPLSRVALHAHNASTLVCFRRAWVGAEERSWGGPGRRFITPALLREFHAHVRRGAYAHAALMAREEDALPPPPARARIAVLLRNGTRVVLNEAALLAGLRAAFPQADVVPFRPETLSFAEQVREAARSTVLLGVHGAGLTNLLFLPDNAAVVEIWPYHWDRRAYQRISGLLNLAYAEWRNEDREATVFHESTFDSFVNCDEEGRQVIRTANEKPMTLRGACGLAAEKYWINQDTRVDVPALVDTVRRAMRQSPLNAPFLENEHSEL